MRTVDVKPWGHCLHLIDEPEVRVDICRIAPLGYSSWHKHEKMTNVFHVLSGRLRIHCEGGKVLTLLAGMQATLPPGVGHRFYATEYTELLEAYHSDPPGLCSLEDIVRFDANGVGECPSTPSGQA